MDPYKNIEQYKAEWTEKVKKALKMKPEFKVVIVKRLPRYDPKSQDPIFKKQSLSQLASKIRIVSLDKMECCAI